MNIEFREKLITTLCAASLFSLTLLFFGPLYLYFTNILEFPYLLSDVWYLFASISLLSILVISVVLLPLKPSVHRKVVSLLFAIAVLLWIQGNILVWKYGVLDGKEINWSVYKVYGFIDIAVWLFFIIIAFFKNILVYNTIKKVSLILILVQIIVVSFVYFKAPTQPEWKMYSINNESKYSFSKEKNVIILILDGFQTDVFYELINEHPEYQDDFKGFTYFRNTVGGFPTTYPSVPLILTGCYYDNTVPMQEFIKGAYSSASIPLILKQNDYQVDLYPQIMQPIYCNENIASNLVNTSRLINRKNVITSMYNLVLFRYVPHFAKKYFSLEGDLEGDLEGGDSSVQKDLDFANKMISQSNADSEKCTFKFIHLRGTHPPFKLNENLEWEESEYGYIGYKKQARAALEITRKFLTALNYIGVYDNSMIFIVGDHGIGLSDNIQAVEHTKDKKVVNVTSSVTIASGIPLILMKPFGSMTDMKISDAPVSLSDIPKTVISELGLKNDLPGCSMLEIKESDSRERRFLFYKWESEYWNKEYLPAMDEYIVNGFSWLNQSWQPTYRRFTSEGIVDIKPPVYEYGSQIQFGNGGNAEQYQGQGWSGPEGGFTWTDGKNATLVIPVNQPQTDLTLSASLFPFIAGEAIKQKVYINVNGKRLGEWDVAADGEYKIKIPKEYIKNSLSEVSFEMPGAVSPQELNISNDARSLGVAMRSIILSQQQIYEYGSQIQFGNGGNAEQYQGQGWSGPEGGFTWTDGKSASLVIPVNQPQSDLTLSASLSPFIAGEVIKQNVYINVNSKRLGEWDVAVNGEYRIKIPKEYITKSSLDICFELQDAVAPSELNISDDTRILGIAMKSIEVLEKN